MGLLLTYNLQFFAKDGPGGEKTEEPTSKKLSDARKEGQVARSKEVTSAFELLFAFILLNLWVERMGIFFVGNIYDLYSQIPQYIKMYDGQVPEQTINRIFVESMTRVLSIMAPFLIVGVAVAFIVNVLQVKWKPTTKPLRPKFNKLNPMSGFKRIFSPMALVELLKSVLKLSLIGYVVYSYLGDHMPPLFQFYSISLNQGIAQVGSLAVNLGIRIALFYMIIAALDFAYQKIKFKKDMKMTKQEVKDEYKMTEGNPEIKGRIRRIQRQMAMSRMMQSVPEADVVVRNPTHFAVALKYDPEKHAAPVVLAKGQDYLALRIVRTAEEHGVSVIENRPLARALYAASEVEREIPAEFYGAVAELLVYIYRMNHRDEMLQ